jgi:tRNA (mo5U34)-methyltransferase
MIPFRLHRRIPLIRRPFHQRDEAVRELTEAKGQLARVEVELAEARRQLAGDPGDETRRQQQIDAIPWYHDFEFPDGLVARSVIENLESHRALWGFMRRALEAINFSGKSVLDIGCWDGYWSFYAEQQGASRVLATDDATQNWTGSAGIELAKELYGSGVEIRKDLSVYRLGQVDELFDVILFMGVFYHLVAPFYAFAQIRHRCREDALVAVEGDFLPDDALGVGPAALYDIGNTARCFLPTLSCLRQFAKAAYFDIVSEQTYHGLPEQPINRVFVVLRPVAAVNPLHQVPPPFDLHRYDPRFREKGGRCADPAAAEVEPVRVC